MKCEVCGASSEYSLCWRHKTKKPLKRGPIAGKSKVSNSADTGKMWEFFLEVWGERSHTSEVSGDSLGDTPNNMYFHHLLYKSQYPKLSYIRDNIILLTAQEHTKVHQDPTFYEEINKRVKQLKEKYL